MSETEHTPRTEHTAGTEDAPRTATEQVLHEFEEAELRLDRDETDPDDAEAADALTPSRPAQESVRKHHRDGDGQGPARPADD
ncbi:hypothetical protein [Streptomyces sp. enrichment culture]|uniref:hypothetical protein n=1 Tax=Streptomyces sp. enrichment culture TaxID=1795815 RepID=UPI003F567F1D